VNGQFADMRFHSPFERVLSAEQVDEKVADPVMRPR
jgi:hypothetical protein